MLSKNKRLKLFTCFIIAMLPLSVYVAYTLLPKKENVQINNTAIDKYTAIQEQYEDLIKRKRQNDDEKSFIVRNLNYMVNQYFNIEKPTERETKGRDNSLALLREIFDTSKQ